MIATAPASTAPASTAPAFDYIVDDDAQPGDLIPAMAKLLISMARQRRQDHPRLRVEDGDQDQEGDGT